MPPSPRDPGLQPERTALAWQRTALSSVGAALVVARLTFDTLGVAALFVLTYCAAHSMVLIRAARRDYHARTEDLPPRPRPPRWALGLHSGLLALQFVLLGVLEVAALLGASSL